MNFKFGKMKSWKLQIPVPKKVHCGEESEHWHCDLCDDEKRRCLAMVETVPLIEYFHHDEL